MATLAQFFPAAAAAAAPKADKPASPAIAADGGAGGDDQPASALEQEKEAMTSGTLLKSAYELAREERIRQCVAHRPLSVCLSPCLCLCLSVCRPRRARLRRRYRARPAEANSTAGTTVSRLA